MSLVAIWLDQQEAKVFHYTTQGIEKSHFKQAHANSHHLHTVDQLEHQRIESELFKQFAHTLNADQEVLIMGPGQAKQHFKHYLEKHHPNTAKKIVGCENMDHPTESQITAFASKYFNTEHLKK